MRFRTFAALSAVVVGCASAPPVSAGEDGDSAALVRALAKSRVSLADGIRQSQANGAAAISAKYELDDSGALMLSVYVAAKGLDADAEHNVIEELIGAPLEGKWAPRTEVFADVPHVARSAQQLALMALSPQPLLALVERLEKTERVVAAIPVVKSRKALLLVTSLVDGTLRERTADLSSGTFVAPSQDGSVHVPVRRHEFVREGAWVVEFGCAGVQDAAGFVFFRISESPRDVEKVLIVNALGENIVAPAPRADGSGFWQVDTGKAFGEPAEIRIYPRER